MPEIKILNYGKVNSYLLKNSNGYLLVDTGFTTRRLDIKKGLEIAGCQPGNLKLIVLTHGDFDHAGNAVFLRDKYGAQIAMHRGESDAVEKGNMLFSRKNMIVLNRAISILLFKIVLPFLRFGKFEKFKPDLYLEDGNTLSDYGFDARILYIPGHTSGSIGILTAEGDLFCGDFLVNGKKPSLNKLTDDFIAANASIAKLRSLNIKTVYPGHGKPFLMEQFIKDNEESNPPLGTGEQKYNFHG